MGGPPPKKFFPKFSKILGGWSQFSSALYGDPRVPSGIKILATVPWPTSAEKKSEISPKIDFLSSYKNVAHAKKVVAMRAYAPHKLSKVQPDRFNFRDFSSKKTNFELTAMHSASSESGKLRLSYDLEFWPGCSAS